MSKSPWGKIGNWAAETEREEAEDREAAAKAAAAPPPPSFPSLKEAVGTTKQKKRTKMSLHEFTMQQSTYSGSAPNRGLNPEEMLRLPSGPKERSLEEMQSGRLGGGFSSYGTRPGSLGPNQGQGRDYKGQRSYGFDNDNRHGGPPQPRVSELDQPSRADGVDNWASMKRQQQTQTMHNSAQVRTGSMYSSLGGGAGPAIASRADEVDNWAFGKKPVSQPQRQQTRSSSFSSGFSGPNPDRWTQNWPQGLVLDAPKTEGQVVVKVNKPNPFGVARPREEVLAEKGLDLEVEMNKEKPSVNGGSRPTSSQSSRPGTPDSTGKETASAILVSGVGEGMVKQKPKVNPFGDAKPREVLLEEKGLDWKKIDLKLEHRGVERLETEQEKKLKDELDLLKKELMQKADDDQSSINDHIHKKEQELELLVRELDDKVRYTQKIFERPGSGSGRPPSRPGSNDGPRAGFHDRPLSTPGAHENRPTYDERRCSRPGAYEETRSGFPQRFSFMPGGYQERRDVDYNERHRSRDTVHYGTRPGDDGKAIQGGGGRGFFGSRDMDRSGSRW